MYVCSSIIKLDKIQSDAMPFEKYLWVQNNTVLLRYNSKAALEISGEAQC